MEQKPIKGDSTLDVNWIRQKFAAALGPSDLEFSVLNRWLQAPVSKAGTPDKDCEIRAKKLAPLLNRTGNPYEASLAVDMAYGTSFQQKWAHVDKTLAAGTVVILKGPAGAVGGQKSVFQDGFHVVLLLDVRLEANKSKPTYVGEKRRPCYVGFDPDISATEESQRLWDKLVKESGSSNDKLESLEKSKLSVILRKMIFGEGIAGVGPLIRKYYPDRSKGLGKINHTGGK